MLNLKILTQVSQLNTAHVKIKTINGTIIGIGLGLGLVPDNTLYILVKYKNDWGGFVFNRYFLCSLIDMFLIESFGKYYESCPIGTLK